jgi:hypothetical protein
MGIRLYPEMTDAQELPVVIWDEDRNPMWAPGGVSPARVYCFIRPDSQTGELQFVSIGLVRFGEFEKARSWHRLVSFGLAAADQLYYSASDRGLIDFLASKSKSGIGRLATADGGHVMVANFADERASLQMHLNYADCAPAEMAMLHDRLDREFVRKRAVLLQHKCDGEFVWPKEKPFVPWGVV